MSDDEKARPLSVPEALERWRDAEREAAVAHRGKDAALLAERVAREASEAARTTADASDRALEAATLAQVSAARTATAAEELARAAGRDMTSATADADAADLAQDDAHRAYWEALDQATARQGQDLSKG
jgi:hypothetical protein